ncbi:hypothetical protein D9611_007151 [Ephemerocybe angulata]|uniref:RING-type domain-containing protein n=1 Tax=Ephemerocybe angulata TaxID=980116 RepID=A0A8H5B1C8_9AGAR|nr:hypothetical protein D9611_007151 [Tulosesus angulatus]
MPAQKFLCNICMKYYELHQLLFLSNGDCGHGFCKTCTEQRQTPTCALCDTPYGDLPPRRLYLDPVEDTPEERARRLTADKSAFLVEPNLKNLKNLRQSLRDAEHDSGEGMSDDSKEEFRKATRILETGAKLLSLRVELGGGRRVNNGSSQLKKMNSDDTDELQARLQSLQSQVDEMPSQIAELRSRKAELRSQIAEIRSQSQALREQRKIEAMMQGAPGDLGEVRKQECAEARKTLAAVDEEDFNLGRGTLYM